jgi:hypothetical protein
VRSAQAIVFGAWRRNQILLPRRRTGGAGRSGKEKSMTTTTGLQARTEPGHSRSQDVDRYVGARMRERRILLGLTQQQLAALIGVT